MCWSSVTRARHLNIHRDRSGAHLGCRNAGGEAFLKSILGVAIHLRVPKIVVATTLAAFATSAPELTVSTVAALSGGRRPGQQRRQYRTVLWARVAVPVSAGISPGFQP
jgi:hypothetical protein